MIELKFMMGILAIIINFSSLNKDLLYCDISFFCLKIYSFETVEVPPLIICSIADIRPFKFKFNFGKLDLGVGTLELPPLPYWPSTLFWMGLIPLDFSFKFYKDFYFKLKMNAVEYFYLYFKDEFLKGGFQVIWLPFVGWYVEDEPKLLGILHKLQKERFFCYINAVLGMRLPEIKKGKSYKTMSPEILFSLAFHPFRSNASFIKKFVIYIFFSTNIEWGRRL